MEAMGNHGNLLPWSPCMSTLAFLVIFVSKNDEKYSRILTVDCISVSLSFYSSVTWDCVSVPLVKEAILLIFHCPCRPVHFPQRCYILNISQCVGVHLYACLCFCNPFVYHNSFNLIWLFAFHCIFLKTLLNEEIPLSILSFSSSCL